MRLRPWHWCVVAFTALIALALLWFGIAYGGLPRLWSHHEHKRIGARDEILSYTAQDIPADPINLRIHGDAAEIMCAFAKAGWARADPVSVRSAAKIAVSVLADRAYPQAPVSSLYFRDHVQTLAFERDTGKSAHRRHHVRLWRVGPDDWYGAATYDRGVGFSLFTLQITHHIGPDVDGERNGVGKLLEAARARYLGASPSRIAPASLHRNGGGDRYRTDGLIYAFALNPGCRTPA